MKIRYLIPVLFFCAASQVNAQVLRDINFKYLYNPDETFVFKMKAVRLTDGWSVFFKLQLRDTTSDNDQFSIQWDMRSDLTEKEGKPLGETPTENRTVKHEITGTIRINLSSASQVVVGKVINTTTNHAWMYYTLLDPGYPKTLYTTVNGQTGNEFIRVGQSTTISGSAPGEGIVISYYNDDFPVASPAFSEALGKVPVTIEPDSIFTTTTAQATTVNKRGLYLVQKDTSSANGVAFRAEEDYPRFAKVESLAGPLVYVCTKQEHQRVLLAKGDKKAFDKIILGITGDVERAKKFIKNYFRNVELANQFFTSYKEGWKTDRGMIYIIFGLPDEVVRFSDREVWNYKNSTHKVAFNFAKSATLYDPDNYVLIRDKKFQRTWYEVIDLWRNARF